MVDLAELKRIANVMDENWMQPLSLVVDDVLAFNEALTAYEQLKENG